MLDPIRSFLRFARGLDGYMRSPLTAEDCLRVIREQNEQRETRFLQIAERGIYDHPRSPYRWLLERAGVGLEDLRGLIADRGLEPALTQLRDAGVRVSIDEFKGRRPIERDGREFPATANDFDNPHLTSHYEGSTSGSRGAGRRILIDLNLLIHEAAHYQAYMDDLELWDRPIGVWYPVPPGSAGMKAMLRYAKVGKRVDRWFTPWPSTIRACGLKRWIFTTYTIHRSRSGPTPIPRPELVRLDDATPIARWLAEMRAAGTPAHLQGSASGAARIAVAARSLGLDISGTTMRLGGEPFTEARERLLTEMGCTAVGHYSMAEIGLIGLNCGHPEVRDETHLLTDKVAVVAEPGPDAETTGSSAIRLTTLHPSTPKIMLNTETDDYGILSNRPCGCRVEQLGLTTHLHSIRSREKLTSGGMSFVGSDLLVLVEESLPRRFGGAPTDYQLVEEETAEGAPRVSIVISPSVGEVDDAAVIETVVRTLSSGGGAQRMMVELWRDGAAIQVRRREPYSNGSKIQPLHVQPASDG